MAKLLLPHLPPAQSEFSVSAAPSLLGHLRPSYHWLLYLLLEGPQSDLTWRSSKKKGL